MPIIIGELSYSSGTDTKTLSMTVKSNIEENSYCLCAFVWNAADLKPINDNLVIGLSKEK